MISRFDLKLTLAIGKFENDSKKGLITLRHLGLEVSLKRTIV